MKYPHGTNSAYAHDGCRCNACKRNRKLYDAKRYRQQSSRRKALSSQWYKANREKAKIKVALWRKNNPEKVAKMRQTHLRKALRNNPGYLREKDWKRHGIRLTWTEYLGLLTTQLNQCCICNCHVTPKGKTSAQVDHDHRTGRVRGLLCHTCNKALGLFNDSIPVIKKALHYLESP
jgi:hypothetical protein